MTDIKPMLSWNIPFERAIALPPGLELDMYVFANVLQGPHDAVSPDRIGGLPGFSRKFGDCHMLLVMASQELGALTVESGPELFELASKAGFMARKNPCITWRISAGGVVGYGRNFEEALCKLLIVAKK